MYKNDVAAVKLLKAARVLYDKTYPNRLNPLKPRKMAKAAKKAPSTTSALSAKSPHIDPKKSTRTSITNLRMSPLLERTTNDNQLPPINENVPYKEDSDADNSNVEEGNTYLQISAEAGNGDNDLSEDEVDASTNKHCKDFFKTNQFTYKPANEGKTLNQPSNMYNGEGPCLRHGVDKQFSTVLECFQVCGGFSYSFVWRLTPKSNGYTKAHITGDKKFAGYKWQKNISVQEMYRFHGVLLKMSIDDQKLVGYKAYFTSKHIINLGVGYSVTLEDYPGWAAKVMSLSQFK